MGQSQTDSSLVADTSCFSSRKAKDEPFSEISLSAKVFLRSLNKHGSDTDCSSLLLEELPRLLLNDTAHLWSLLSVCCLIYSNWADSGMHGILHTLCNRSFSFLHTSWLFLCSCHSGGFSIRASVSSQTWATSTLMTWTSFCKLSSLCSF